MANPYQGINNLTTKRLDYQLLYAKKKKKSSVAQMQFIFHVLVGSPSFFSSCDCKLPVSDTFAPKKINATVTPKTHLCASAFSESDWFYLEIVLN